MSSEDSDQEMERSPLSQSTPRVKVDGHEAGSSKKMTIETSFGTQSDLKRKKEDEGSQSSQGSQPDTPSKAKYEFNYFQAKRAKKSLEQTELKTLKIGDLSAKSVIPEKLRVRISYLSSMDKTKNKNIDTFSFSGFDGIEDISGVVYGTAAVKLFGKFKVNLVYDICKFGVAESGWNPLHKFEIKLFESSVIELVDDETFPEIRFDFISPHAKIYDIEDGNRADILGVLVQDWGLQPVGREDKLILKRDVNIIDSDAPETKNVLVTFWGKVAEEFQADIGSVIVIRKGVVQSFNNMKKLSINNTLVLVNPDWPNILGAVQKVKKWFEEANAMDED